MKTMFIESSKRAFTLSVLIPVALAVLRDNPTLAADGAADAAPTAAEPVLADAGSPDAAAMGESYIIARNVTVPLTVNGTGKSASFVVNTRNLSPDLPVNLTASAGFAVSPATLPPDSRNAKVTVTLISSLPETKGAVVLRSGDVRSYVQLTGVGTPLPKKEISKSPVFASGDAPNFVKTAAEGFLPSASGYTVEFKIKINNEDQVFYPYAVTDRGVGFKAYINSSELGAFNSTGRKPFSNPATSVAGGLRKFYNNDGRSHTYRIAVTPDDRAFLYRDGLLVDVVRLKDFALQPEFATGTGPMVDNLLKNPGFEGEFSTQGSDAMARAIEGWNVGAIDIYNSRQYVVPQEIDNQQDCNNHVIRIERYRWANGGGWGPSVIEQIVDVAPNEQYTLSALARGGIKSDGTRLGKIRIQEVQDTTRQTAMEVLDKSWDTYTTDFTTSPDCHQLRVFLFLQKDKRGASIAPLEVDNVKLAGKTLTYSARVGFVNSGANVDYFTYDLSGAYAPIAPELNLSVK